MIIPIKCFTCGTVLADKYRYFQEEVAKILFKVLPLKGILNIGGKLQSPYKFGKITNPNIRPISRKYDQLFKLFPDTSMNIKKLENFLNKSAKI
jgi:hypothetical protein